MARYPRCVTLSRSRCRVPRKKNSSVSAGTSPEYDYASEGKSPMICRLLWRLSHFSRTACMFFRPANVSAERVFKKIPCEHDDELDERLYGEHYYHGICHSPPFRSRKPQPVFDAVTRPAPEYRSRQSEHHDGGRDLENPQESVVRNSAVYPVLLQTYSAKGTKRRWPLPRAGYRRQYETHEQYAGRVGIKKPFLFRMAMAFYSKVLCLVLMCGRYFRCL